MCIFATFLLLCAATLAQAGIAATLSGLKFFHEGVVGSPADNTSYFVQCNGFSEDLNLWTQWGPRSYLYNVSAGGELVAPAMGLRSALPLGGMGTGSFELRADGVFADWMIENQGTAAATDATRNGKIPFKDEAVLGVYSSLQGGAPGSAVSLRTAPPGTLPRADTLTYSAAHPFARLQYASAAAALPGASVYAYSPFAPWNSEDSGIPAVAFTLVATNPHASPLNLSFLLSLPLGTAKDTDRPLGATPNGFVPGTDPRNQTLAVLQNTTAAACLAACAAEEACVWWSHTGDGTPSIPPVTMVNNDCPGNDVYPRYIVSTLEECTAQCAAAGPSVGCRGVVLDQIPSEQQGQCNNTDPTKYCCLLKTACTDLSPKTGDTAWAAGVPGVPPQQCSLMALAPAVEQYSLNPTAAAVRGYSNTTATSGPRSGVKGSWQPSPDGTGLWHIRNSSFDGSAEGSWQDPAAATATYALLVAGADLDPSLTVSSGWGNDLDALWADFAADGVLNSNSSSGSSTAMAGHGALAVSLTLQPGHTRDVTIVFAWHLPYRLYVGQQVGNNYAIRYPSAGAVAADVAARLPNIVTTAAEWNAALANSSLPDYFLDFAMNALASQVKMSVWVADDAEGNPLPGGRYRQFEAYSNSDLDPVHVSSYHAIPYTLFWPDLAANVLSTGWATRQQGNGMIQEFLGDFSAPHGRITGPMDISAGGRTMADTTTVFILWSYGVYMATGDESFLTGIYPSISRAAGWQIARAGSGPNASFPPYLQNTYDYLGLDQYPYQAYTGFLHLAAMRAVQQLAAAVGDTSPLAHQAAASAANVIAAMQSALWVADGPAGPGYWRAWQIAAGDAPAAVMSGSLHGQNWAAWLGLGALAPRDQLASHVAAEIAANCNYTAAWGGGCGYGQLTLPLAPGQSSWSLHASPSQSMDNTAAAVWLLGIEQLDSSPAAAVMRLYGIGSGGSSDAGAGQQGLGLRDLFNVHDLHIGPGGLSCSGAGVQISGSALAGAPFVNAHYARHVQAWAIMLAAVGQSWDAPSRRLTLAPAALRVGDRLPWFIHGAAGMLELHAPIACDTHGIVTAVVVRVTMGQLQAGEVTVQLRRSSPSGGNSGDGMCVGTATNVSAASKGATLALTWKIVA